MQKKPPTVDQLLKENKALKTEIRKLEHSETQHIQMEKQNEETLQASELSYKTVFESTGTTMLIVEEDMTIYLASGGFKELTGYTQEEIIGERKWMDLVDPGDVEQMVAYHRLRRVNPDAVPKSYEFRLIRKDGSVRHIILTVDMIPGTRRSVASLMDISARKQAEEALRQSEERYRSILDNIEDGYYETDIKGSMTFVNESVCRILGYSRNELIGMNYREYIHPESLTELFSTFNKVYTKGEPARGVSWPIIRKDGTVRHIETSVSLKKDTSGKPVGFLGINRDITERKRMEAELMRIRDFVENVEDGCIELDLQGNLTFCNSAFLKLTGYTPVEYNALSHWGRQPSRKEGEKIFNTYNEVYLTGIAARSVEHEILLKDGSVRIWDVSISLIRDKSGTPVGFRSIGRDITKRKRMEEALRRSEERYRTILDEMADGYFEVNLAGHYTFVNDANCRLLGYPREELIGTSFRNQVAKEDIPLLYDVFKSIYATGNPVRGFTYKAIRKDGSTGVGEISAFPLRDEKSAVVGFRGIAKNITDRKRAEEEKAKLQDQLIQAQKMESVGRLAGGVAHDFNNMLNVILGRTEMAMQQAGSGHPITGHLTEIQKAAERSANMTRQLLAFARKQTVSPKVLDLNETVEAMLRMLRQLMGEDIQLTWHPGSQLWPIRIDPSQVDQILANLCVNARDAINGVGNVTIATENMTFDQAYCSHHMDCVPGDYAMLSVTDDGCGMSQEIRAKLFEPYFTTKGIGKGTGLGLATIYGIIKQNNGFINVYSEPGQGTTFKIYLRRHSGGADRTEVQDEQEQNYEGKETVLIVEDEPSILSMCRMMLESYGYRVMIAGTPGKALHLADQHGGQFHLLISDVIMPEMNGRDLARKLLIRYPDLKCLFMSGYPADVIAHHGVLDAGVHFIQKPFSGKSLVEKVRAALDQN